MSKCVTRTVLLGLITFAAVSSGWHEPMVIAEESPVSLEWTDLAFTVVEAVPFNTEQLPESVRALEGKLVRVRGYFHMGTAKAASFVLLGLKQAYRDVWEGRRWVGGSAQEWTCAV